MKRLKTFIQFINEAAPAPTSPPKEEEDATQTPTTTSTAPASTSGSTEGAEVGTAPESSSGDATQVDSSMTTDPNAAGGIPPAPGTDPAAGAAPTDASGAAGSTNGGTDLGGGMPNLGGSTPSSSSSAGVGGGGLGAPPTDGSAPAPDAGQGQEGEENSDDPKNYIAPVSKFNIVMNDKNARWSQEYPDGGGVKEMEGYEVTWKDLNKWIDENQLGEKKKDISEYLLGETENLDDDIKQKLKQAFDEGKIGNKTGKTEIEFDDDQTPYVQNLSTILVNL